MAVRVALMCLLAVAACSSGGPPAVPADITGTITRVSAGTILVEEHPSDTAGSQKASIRMTTATMFWRQTGSTPQPASAADLKEGQRASAWFEGPVLESYPVQATAKAIVILQSP